LIGNRVRRFDEHLVMGNVAWFHFCGNQDLAANGVLDRLASGGIQLCPFEKGAPCGNGILCFPEINDALWLLLREIGGYARGRVLALATSPSILAGGVSWRLLHAGACDVLAWDELGAVTPQIRARLERWAAIDKLTESAAVQDVLAGNSLAWRELMRTIVEAAYYTSAPVLLIGESGTGKELLARLIHQVDGRAGEAGGSGRELVTVDCSTIVPELSGSELFGHERGAFTGAAGPREGAFALANGGTLFLDEGLWCKTLSDER
jgi:hypothetical protein